MRMIATNGNARSGSAADDASAPELVRQRDQAVAHARALEHELGTLRGRVKRLELIMWRRTARRRRAAAWAMRLRRVLER
jgi:hypothetical protein